MAKLSLQELIAQAIQEADRSYFNENYAKQAAAVLTALKKSGYEVVPLQPSDDFVEFVHKNMPFGRLRPSELIRLLYTLMVQNVKKFDK